MRTPWIPVRTCLLLAVSIPVLIAEPSANSYDPDYGVFLGSLDGDELRGQVYLVNESTIQVVNFTYAPQSDTFFWLDASESLTKSGVKIPTFEFGVTPVGEIGKPHCMVLQIPGGKKVTEFKVFGLYAPSERQSLAEIPIPADVIVPKSQFLSKELSGSRYSVGSGPILIQDRRTIKIFAFTFDADKAPDGYFFVGRGVNVVHDAGIKVPIRGRDDPDNITPMNQRYRGGHDIVLDLPKGYDVNHIDWLAVYCYKFRVDFGHVSVSELGQYLPPYVAPFKSARSTTPGAWRLQPLLGTPVRTNFVLQLGPAGGKRGYQGAMGLVPPPYVWYVNGVMAEVYLKRGVNYTFTVEAGTNHSFYISDDQFGGIDKLEEDEKQAVAVFAPEKSEWSSSDRNCVWDSDSDDPDKFDSFAEFRGTLRLKCDQKNAEPAVLSFTPNRTTPSLIYGNAVHHYYMGFPIHVVDQFPADIVDVEEAPFESDAWINRTNSVAALCSTFFLVLISCVALT